MKYRRLGRTDLEVSVICLGSMTWGEQNTETEGHEQLDMALDAGVNFIDTAEMYSFPARAETTGASERCVGSWLKRRQVRDRVVIATKVTGRDFWLPHIRGGKTRLDRKNIEQAIDGSLQRLQIDTIDLYQLHWPDRKTNFFGKLGYEHDEDDVAIPIAETRQVLGDLVTAGKVRHIGLSNETPWGIMSFIKCTDELGLPRVVSVQNPYSLLCRTFEIGNAEIAHREDVGLLAYSPLGFGVLSGKYLHGAQPSDARLTLYPQYSRYANDNAIRATESYVALAKEHGLDPAQMALAYCNSRSFLTSTIITATTLEQLRTDIDSIDLNLSAEVLEGIEAIHNNFPNPAP